MEVRAGSDLLVTGYIESVGHRYSANDHTLALAGRSECCDLIDASAEIERWHGQRIGAEILPLAKELYANYGNEVVDLRGGNNPKIETFTANLGDPPCEILERVSRSIQLLVFDDPQL